MFSVSGFFWPERSSDDAEALLSLASSNLKYAMTVGWEDGMFYYEDDLGKTNSTVTYAKKTWHSIVLTTEKIASDTYHDASGVNTAKRLVKVYVDGSLAISKQTLLPDLAEDAAGGGKGAGYFTAGVEHRQYAKGKYFSGLMGELVLYHETLTATEAADLPFTPPAAPYTDAMGVAYHPDLSSLPEGDLREGTYKITDKVSGKGKFSAAYVDRVSVGVMPYTTIAVTSIAKANAFTNTLYTKYEGPIGGTTLTVEGTNFANSPFLFASFGDTDASVEYISTSKVLVHMPAIALSKKGTKTVAVGNGGANKHTFSFEYFYTMGEDFTGDLAAHYEFAGDLLNAKDDGTTAEVPNSYAGAPTYVTDRNGVESSALAFGAGQRIETPALVGAETNYTIAMWVYVEPTNATLYVERNSGSHSDTGHKITITSAGLVALDGVVSAGKIIYDAWQFIAVVGSYTGEAEVYVGGVSAGKIAYSAFTTLTEGLIGSDLVGKVDDFWAWSRSLDAEEIADLYAAEKYAVEVDGTQTFDITTASGTFDSAAWRSGSLISFDIWVKPSSITGTQVLLEQNTADDSKKAVYVALNGAKIEFQVMIDSTVPIYRSVATSADVITADTWALVSVTYDKVNMQIGLNGVAQSIGTASTVGGVLSVNTPYSTTITFQNGGNDDPQDVEASTKVMAVGSGFRGLIGEVILWSKALTATEMASYFSCPPNGDAGIFAHFKLSSAMGYTEGSGAATLAYSGGDTLFWLQSAYGTPTGAISWAHAEVTGQGSYEAFVDTDATFTFQARGSCGRLRKAGGDQVQVVLAGPLDKHMFIFTGTSVDNGDGTYTGTYKHTSAGFYALRVESTDVPIKDGTYTSGNVAGSRGTYDSKMAKGSPLKLYMHPGATDATKSYLYDDADLLENNDLDSGYAGVPATVTLVSVDKFGNTRTKGGDYFDVTLSGGEDKDGDFTDHGDGTYTISYTPLRKGPAYLNVMLDGVHVGTANEADPKDNGISLGTDFVGSPFCLAIADAGSVSFDGLGYVEMSHADDLNMPSEFTVEADIYPTAALQTTHFFAKESAVSGKGHYVGLASGALTASFYVGSDTFREVTTTFTPSTSTWTHVSAAYDGYTLSVYANGILVGSAKYEAKMTAKENSQKVLIGKDFAGLVDNVRIVNDALSATEVSASMRCPMEATSTVLNLMMNEQTGTHVYDYSGVGAVGTFRGSSAPTFSTTAAPSSVGVLGMAESSITGDGLAFATSGVQSSFTMTLMDKCGFPYIGATAAAVAAPLDMLTTTFSAPTHDEFAYPLTIPVQLPMVTSTISPATCLGNGTFTSTYTPDECGTARLQLSVEGDAAPGSPFLVAISNNPTTAAATSVASDISNAVAGEPTHFTITAKDASGCPKTAGGDAFTVLLTRTSKSDGNLLRGIDAVTQTLATTDNGDGTYDVVFTAPAGGDYQIDIGLASVAIAGSPYKFSASDAPWSEVLVSTKPAAGYGSSAAVYGDYMYLFNGWGANKEPKSSVMRYKVKEASTYAYRVKASFSATPTKTARITVDTADLVRAGKMRKDCADVKFVTASGASADYWMDALPGCSAPTTHFWVDVSGMGTDTSMYMYYGNQEATSGALADPSGLFASYDDFEADPFASGWSAATTCSMPSTDATAFVNATTTSKTGSSALEIDAVGTVGGSIEKPLASLSKYVLKAAFYDSDDTTSAMWISPNFVDCSAAKQSPTKNFLDQNYGLGVETKSIASEYAMMYPWIKSGVARSAGWHSLEITSDGTTATFLVDDVAVGTKIAADLTKVFINGRAAKSSWDTVYVAETEALTTTYGAEEAVVDNTNEFATVNHKGTTHAPPTRHGSAVTLHGTKAWFAEGFACDVDFVYAYDFAGATYEKFTPWGSARPGCREYHSQGVHDGKLYVYGGRAGSSILGDMWAYDIADNYWSKVATSGGPAARYSHVAAVYGGTMFVYGGVTAEGASGETWGFTFATGTWVNLTPLTSPSPRYDMVVAVSGEVMYIYGGKGDAGATGDTWQYSFNLNHWTLVNGSGKAATCGAAAAVAGDTLFLFGGEGATKYYDSLESLKVMP